MTEESKDLTVAPRTEVTAGSEVAGLIPKTIEEAYRLAVAIAKSGLAPNSMSTPEKCLVAIMAGAEVGLAPFQAVQGFAVINGRPVLWGDAMLAVVRSKGFFVEEWADGEGEERIAFCRVIRPDNKQEIVREFTVEQAKRAGLWQKRGNQGQDTPWVTYPERMLQMRARAFALRDAAADALKGFAMREEVVDIEVVEETPPRSGLRERLEANQTPREEGFNIENPETQEDLFAEIEPIGGERPLRREDYASDADFEDAVMSKPRDEYDGPNVSAPAVGQSSATEAVTLVLEPGTDAGTSDTGDDTFDYGTAVRIAKYVDELRAAKSRTRLKTLRDRAHDLLNLLSQTDPDRAEACDAVFNKCWVELS